MNHGSHAVHRAQERRNAALLDGARYLGLRVESDVLPVRFDVDSNKGLSAAQVTLWEALQIQAARTAIRALGSLAGIGEVDHLGGGLELIPAFLMTLALTDYEAVHYTIEHAHTSIGYYAALAALGFLEEEDVVSGFRRGLDVPGHVSWVPGGTQLNGGRLGVMIPTAVGQALGLRARHGSSAWVLAHCGDAGWISGQALNGFNAAHVHRAPITFIMHRNGIQLSGTTRSVMDVDPRPIISSLGVEVVEVPSLHEPEGLFSAYRQARALAREGRPSMIYPVGYRSSGGERVDLAGLGRMYGISKEVAAMAAACGVPEDREIWIPGSLMSYRDVQSMLECVFAVNDLPGGKTHHDGHMKGRDVDSVLAGPMLQSSPAQEEALKRAREQVARHVVTRARPAPGVANLELGAADLQEADLPGPGTWESPRSGSEAAYALLAKRFAERMFVVSCDLDPSTKLARARSLLPSDHGFEMSIEEQAATLMADGLALCGAAGQLTVVSTFAAFFEGIAREGFDMWRYQRNLTGANEGLNVTFHLSHVGACTGRDHFSGWGLDWVNVGLTYLPYLHRFYAPADAGAAFQAVVDLAAHYGGHIIGIPRDKLPVLGVQEGSGPLYPADAPWQAVTEYRRFTGSRKAILALGAPAFLAGQAADELQEAGEAVDVHIVNGLPLPEGRLEALLGRYPEGVVTVEDGLIGDEHSGVRGFAGWVAAAACAQGVPAAHVGITDPRIAPSQGHMETWEHFGITAAALAEAVRTVGRTGHA